MTENTFEKRVTSINVNVEVALFEEDNMWIAYCPALEVSSYGDGKKEAKEAFEEAMQIFLSETERKGTLEKFLLKLGWQLQQKPIPVYNPPHFSIQENKTLLKKDPLIYNQKVSIPVA